jgi:hypothetical protein
MKTKHIVKKLVDDKENIVFSGSYKKAMLAYVFEYNKGEYNALWLIAPDNTIIKSSYNPII